MSPYENEPDLGPDAGSGLSSVKLTQAAKGETRVEVKVYSRSNEHDDVHAASAHAAALYDGLRARYPS